MKVLCISKWATAPSPEEMHAALDVNMPYYASTIVGAEEIVASVSAL